MSGSSPSVDAVRFRSLLSRFATGVAVATALDQDGRPAGMTASAVSSVSLDPPILLLCVGQDADFHGVLRGAARFALNVLACDQEHLARQFASTHPDRFEGVACVAGPGGVPLLEGAVVHIICEPWGSQEVGDHTVFFGRVVEGAATDRAPLVYHRSEYTSTGDRSRNTGLDP